jgi:hypothetical protein
LGTTYHYTNLTKREWFSADALGGSSKFHGLGLNLTARAFDLLLLDLKHTNPTSLTSVDVGRWIGDHVALIGDTDDNWSMYYEQFADIEADVILMLFAYDGFEHLAAAAEDDDGLFRQLCHLALTGQAPALTPHLSQLFGTNFRQRYKELCGKAAWDSPKNVAFAKGS